ncbi:MAG: hypothetical protein CVV51_03570 [Spirochaetae bacterium HGW-Spirochaetae-7]|jgi:predicted CXXCH cytochrome family protein|nr:MAG: hypothetical protein CVV51_03570 [Spirochaetae bacterium HGW-Spirochaetae-7]
MMIEKRRRFYSALRCLLIASLAAVLASCTPESAGKPIQASLLAGSLVQPGRLFILSLQPSASRIPLVAFRAGNDSANAVEATSSATPTDATSSATQANDLVETEDPVAAECLKCHGPFGKIVEGTKDYVTEWDEKANPHTFVPHDSKTIVNCTECHVPHGIPVTPAVKFEKANVKYCYSCHHAETLVSCSQCHQE